MRRLLLFALLGLLMTGCREVRVKTYAQGTTAVSGGNQVLVIRDPRGLEELGIHAPVRFRNEFVVILLMGPHEESGWHQVIESIRANEYRVRIVAFEHPPVDGGEPTKEFRTYTMWIVPNSVYEPGSQVDVVTPSGDPIASTVLK